MMVGCVQVLVLVRCRAVAVTVIAATIVIVIVIVVFVVVAAAAVVVVVVISVFIFAIVVGIVVVDDDRVEGRECNVTLLGAEARHDHVTELQRVVIGFAVRERPQTHTAAAGSGHQGDGVGEPVRCYGTGVGSTTRCLGNGGGRWQLGCQHQGYVTERQKHALAQGAVRRWVGGEEV